MFVDEVFADDEVTGRGDGEIVSVVEQVGRAGLEEELEGVGFTGSELEDLSLSSRASIGGAEIEAAFVVMDAFAAGEAGCTSMISAGSEVVFGRVDVFEVNPRYFQGGSFSDVVLSFGVIP